MVLMGYSGARGTLIYEKNLMSKISCHTPFNLIAVAHLFEDSVRANNRTRDQPCTT
jgi:hypothetical protein